MTELREITKENLEEVLRLTVWEHQQAFVSSVAHSLAQAYVYRNTAFPFAVYADGAVVGFIMLGYYAERDQYTLWKLLIDKKHQNKGYGMAALRLGIAYLQKEHGAREIFTGVSPGNQLAKHVYHLRGFRETGLVENNMEEMKYTC